MALVLGIALGHSSFLAGAQWLALQPETPLASTLLRPGQNKIKIPGNATSADATLNVYCLPPHPDLDYHRIQDRWLGFVSALDFFPRLAGGNFGRRAALSRHDFLHFAQRLRGYLEPMYPSPLGPSFQKEAWLESERQFFAATDATVTRRLAIQSLVRLSNQLHVPNYVPLKLGFVDTAEEIDLFRRAAGLGMFVFWKQQYFLHDQPLTREDLALWIFGLPPLQRDFKQYKKLDFDQLLVLRDADTLKRWLREKNYRDLLRYGYYLQRDWHQELSSELQAQWTEHWLQGLHQSLLRASFPREQSEADGDAAYWELLLDNSRQPLDARLQRYSKFPWTRYFPPIYDSITLRDRIREIRKRRRGNEKLSQQADVFSTAVLFWMQGQLNTEFRFEQLQWRYALAHFLVRHRFVSREALDLLKEAPQAQYLYHQLCSAVKQKNISQLNQAIDDLHAAYPHEPQISAIATVVSANRQATEVGQSFYVYRNASEVWSDKMFDNLAKMPFFKGDYFKPPLATKVLELRAIARHLFRLGQPYAALQLYAVVVELTELQEPALMLECLQLLYQDADFSFISDEEQAILAQLNPWGSLFATGGVKDPYW